MLVSLVVKWGTRLAVCEGLQINCKSDRFADFSGNLPLARYLFFGM